MNQLQTVPTTAVNNPPSPSLTNNEDEHQNDDESTKEVIMGGKESGNSDDDNDSSICSGDSGCSGDDGSEAEIHDAGTEFEPMENTIDDMYGVDFVQGLPGSPDGWSPPGPPDGWVYNPPDGSPKEEDIDNPANWNLYSFSPKINASTKKYEGHFTPAGAKVVPTTPDGSREIGGWTFHYNGWKADEFDKATFVRDDASHGNLKPESRKGRLDVDILKKHGLNATRMKDDPLFFYQMLFPIADPKHSTIDGDGRMPYFSMASVCTNVYAAASGAGSGVGHDWVGVTAPELVKWTACPIRNGALDGKPATLTARWKRDDPRYDSYTAENISQTRFKMIKRFFKLNNNLMDAKKGDAGYNPCSKYDFIYKVLIHNMNYVTQFADLDATIDESTWGFGGFSGECGGRLINKPVSRGKYKMSRYHHPIYPTRNQLSTLPTTVNNPPSSSSSENDGDQNKKQSHEARGQIAMLFDINHRYPRAYVHRHKLHPRHPPFKAVGQSEVVMLVGMIDLLLKDQAADADEPKIAIQNPTSATRLEYTLKQVYQKPPHITADNFFSSDKARRKSDVDKVDARSTGGTNIIGVNNLPSVKLYVGQKERGRKKDGSKRVYGIEQNEARETYLGHYYGLDNADHMIKNTGNRYITWKYWHAPYLHAQSLGIIAAYDMYTECCEGSLDAAWAIEVKNRMTFSQFRIRLSVQMLSYNPVDNMYPGDKTFRINTKTHKARRKSDVDNVDARVGIGPSAEGATMDHYQAALASGRLCSTLEEIREHFMSVYVDAGNNRLPCEACGTMTTWRCGLCDKAMCTTIKRKWSGNKCILAYHSHEFFGLSRSDKAQLEGKDVRSWTAPNK
ncbi:hypothetical protein ACHAXH_000395 [Discostella pseudostelligera]